MCEIVGKLWFPRWAIPSPTQPAYLRYSFAVVVVGMTVGVKLLIDPLLANTAPFLLMVFGVFLSSFLGGLGPGLLATLLSTAAVDFFFLPPLYSIPFQEPRFFLPLGLFAAQGLVVSYTVYFMQQALLQSQIAFQDLAQETARREETQQLLLQTQAALRTSEEQFFNNYAAVGMLSLALDGRIQKANHTFAEAIGSDRTALVGRSLLELVHSEDVPVLQVTIERLRHGKCPYEHSERRYPHHNGHIVTMLESISAICDAEGQPQYIVSLLQDITQRKQAEQT